jgi:hypothetical protein
MDLSFRGSGEATIQCTAADPPIATGLVWDHLAVNAQDPLLGDVALVLNPTVLSTASIDSTGLDVNHFFFEIAATNLGSTPLVSDDPIVMVGTIESFPPTATFTKAGADPVDFYRLGDVTKTTVASVTGGTAEVVGIPIAVSRSSWAVIKSLYR